MMMNRNQCMQLLTVWGVYALGFAGPVYSQAYDVETAPSAHSFTWPEGIKMGLSLTFDDARFSQIENGVPLLDKYHLKGTFYVSVTRIEERLELWKKAVQNGHDIGNHSLRHGCARNFDWSRDKALESYTLEQMQTEIATASDLIHKQLGIQPRSFAYPCGQTYIGEGTHTRSYVPVIASGFQTGRTWYDEKPNDPAFCNMHQLTGIKLDGLSPEEAIALVKQAAEDGDWLIFVSHETVAEGRENSLTTTLTTLEAICQFATHRDHGVWMDSVQSIATYVTEQNRTKP